jgi:DNA polymerase-1
MTSKIVLPNVRKLFTPDPGYVLFDADLAGADAQVVAWEAEDEDLKAAFRAGLDVHAKNAEDMWGASFARLEPQSHAWKSKRKQCKQAVHLTNYGGSGRAMAMVLGWTVREAEDFQRRWFSLHPGIKHNFHGRVQKALDSSKTVYNKFGFRRVYFDRPDQCFTEALAWIPQSTVGLTTYYGEMQLLEKYPYCEDLLQVHDSLVFQMPKHHNGWTYKGIVEALAVPIPYDDPLIIPWGLAMSETSWGDCKKVDLKEAA